ncbi:NAD(P)/FAD-dependent oxidoreductase [uncultured Ruegeria sp.]|uniref:NAD(P)/FAD-dependent oxidoreductase n=1 Tax=uncultured Ruegeria sp. TaxID=259304 RepID=UPI0026378769|nr:NAD(P)/FAD-dependent oxidoreductase [uncultured Ruegeria sp.]
MDEVETADVAVIGGGPAGSVMAGLCAKAGLSTVLLERDTGPRYRIGESLLPATLRQVLPLIGAQDAVDAEAYTAKRGATFCWGADKQDIWTLAFGPDQADDPPVALNVDRASFDEILLSSAQNCGATLRRGYDAVSVGDGNTQQGRSVTYSHRESGKQNTLRARFVVNATGQMRLNIPELDAREHSQFFRKVAVWGYWTGGGRLDAPLDGNVFFETLETEHGTAWVWYIPLRNGLTSVGVVTPRDCLAKLRVDPRAGLANWLATCPRITELLRNATPAKHTPYDQVSLCADYSYASNAFSAPGVLQIGDAACFVDVLLSSGVHLATYGALLAARSIKATLSGAVPEDIAMAEYESRLRQEFSVFYAGLSGLYDMDKRSQDYVGWLRALLQNSNGVLMEWGQTLDNPGGLNVGGSSCSGADLRTQAQRNLTMMRGYNSYQLAYDGPPKATPIAALPAIRNLLAIDERGEWIMPAHTPHTRPLAASDA